MQHDGDEIEQNGFLEEWPMFIKSEQDKIAYRTNEDCPVPELDSITTQ